MDPHSKDGATIDPTSAEERTKIRIITHMNTDHQDSLIRYLSHYAHLSSFSARNARLVSITFSHMIILSSSSTPHTIPINPPLESWAEVRPRVVQMDAECTAALGRSSVTVKSYKPPRGFMTVVMVACALTFAAFCRRVNFVPGSLLYTALLRNVPRFADFCWTIQPLVIYPMALLHAAEATYMARSRLEKHTVRWGSRVWWTWVGSAFLEGWGSIVRFDEVVREEEERKAKLKH